MAHKKTVPGSIEHTIALKEKLIKRLTKEIAEVEAATEKDVNRIRFRITMAQTLLHALKRGKASRP
jgi:hypothetical protein